MSFRCRNTALESRRFLDKEPEHSTPQSQVPEPFRMERERDVNVKGMKIFDNSR